MRSQDTTRGLVKYQQRYIDINKINKSFLDQSIIVNGWVRNKRIQSSLALID
jgi:hypothetical protein